MVSSLVWDWSNSFIFAWSTSSNQLVLPCQQCHILNWKSCVQNQNHENQKFQTKSFSKTLHTGLFHWEKYSAMHLFPEQPHFNETEHLLRQITILLNYSSKLCWKIFYQHQPPLSWNSYGIHVVPRNAQTTQHLRQRVAL